MMIKLYKYINSINLLSIISIILLWVNHFMGTDFLSHVIVNNYIALTAVYSPGILVVLQVIIIAIQAVSRREVEYYQKVAALFSFINSSYFASEQSTSISGALGA